MHSGYYVTTDCPGLLDRLPAFLTSPAFASYVRALGKYKSGGYYTFNTLDLEQYLNFQIQQTVKRSSSEHGSYGAWYVYFNDGYVINRSKDNIDFQRVRFVRDLQ